MLVADPHVAQHLPWRMLLDEPAAEQAHAAISDIATGLATTVTRLRSQTNESPGQARRYGLTAGLAGFALFADSFEGGAFTGFPSADLLLRDALAAQRDIPLDMSLSDGLPGLAWTAAHLGARNSSALARSPAEALIEQIENRLSASGPLEEYDLLYGLVGVGVAALACLPSPAATRCLEQIVARLDALAEWSTAGATWWTSPTRTGQPETFPRGHYALGVAHGVPGVIALLAQTWAAGIAISTVARLLDGAVAWLLAQRPPTGGLPTAVAPGQTLPPAWLAWCWGDPGVAAALLVAARAANEPAWEREALDLAHGAASRSPEAAGIVDARFCHGTLGLAHLYNRLAQATGSATLERAARDWYARGLAARRPGERLGGFSVLEPRPDGRPRRVAYHGLLNGALGVGLALLAAATPVEPTWDAALLLSPIRAPRSPSSAEEHHRSTRSV
jgi:hypothetical protein